MLKKIFTLTFLSTLFLFANNDMQSNLEDKLATCEKTYESCLADCENNKAELYDECVAKCETNLNNCQDKAEQTFSENK